MGFLDKAKDLLGQHDDKVDQALNKAGDMAKDKFAGHDSQIDKATEFAREKTGEGDTTHPQGEAPPPAPGEQPPPPPQQ